MRAVLQPRSDDADDTDVPGLAALDDDEVGLCAELGAEGADGFFGNGAFDLLALTVATVERLGEGQLPAPAIETIRVFEDRFDGLERRLATLTEETRKSSASLSETGHRLEEARLEREVPTEADLEAARTLRGRGWGLIACRLNSEAVSADELQFFMQSFPGAASLSAAFAASIEQSDALADRLRREADRVAVKARLLADQAAFTHQAKQLGEELVALRAERETAAAEWAGVWQAFNPRLLYCFALALGIYISMLREQRRPKGVPRTPFRRVVAIFGVWTFFAIIHLWAKDHMTHAQRFHFLLGLFGLG